MHKILAQLKAMTKLTEFSGQRISLTYPVYHNGLLNSSPDFIRVNYQFLQLNFLQAVHCKTRTLSNKKMKLRWPLSTSHYQKITNVPNPHKMCLPTYNVMHSFVCDTAIFSLISIKQALLFFRDMYIQNSCQEFK